MHDVAALERAGTSAVAVLSDAFASQGLFQADALGIGRKDAERLLVLAQHPISDATRGEIAAKADALYAELLRALTTDAPPNAALRRRLRAAAPLSDECAAGG